MRNVPTFRWLPLTALALVAGLTTTSVSAQNVRVDVEGYLCREPVDVEQFQKLASNNPSMSRAAALSRYNGSSEQPRCEWYERTVMIYKGALEDDHGDKAVKHLFVGAKGHVFEVLVFETPESAETLYSWRRTKGQAG